MIRVLFVCLGNICRSPMAEAVFRDLVNKENLSEKIAVDSAGTSDWHVGEQPHEGTRKILDEQNIAYEGMKARQVSKNDLDAFDYIIAMDEQNITDLNNLLKKGDKDIKLAKLTDYIDQADEENVPDPYFTGDFSYTYRLIYSGVKNLLTHIRNTYHI
ncbi:MAG TPA: low molecular weight protein-tyrosine-phosphatase [Pseudogracilibacillus sp.]|nr:low molecular weight protein-tyrosine-phosphatase [Pseudogracilibacillus sp.]